MLYVTLYGEENNFTVLCTEIHCICDKGFVRLLVVIWCWYCLIHCLHPSCYARQGDARLLICIHLLIINYCATKMALKKWLVVVDMEHFVVQATGQLQFLFLSDWSVFVIAPKKNILSLSSAKRTVLNELNILLFTWRIIIALSL